MADRRSRRIALVYVQNNIQKCLELLLIFSVSWQSPGKEQLQEFVKNELSDDRFVKTPQVFGRKTHERAFCRFLMLCLFTKQGFSSIRNDNAEALL